MRNDPISIARRSYQAYLDKDRAAIEDIVGDDFISRVRWTIA
jgi:hypothetical protein